MKKLSKITGKPVIVFMGAALLSSMACASNEEVLFVESSALADTVDIALEKENSYDQTTSDVSVAAKNKTSTDTWVAAEDKTSTDVSASGKNITSTGTDLQNGSSGASEKNGQSAEPSMIVHVCGAVKLPGVYELPWNARVMDAVTAAGGMREDADAEYVNLAEVVSDGDKIRIPTREEVKSLITDEQGTQGLEVITSNSEGGLETDTTSLPGKVNINTADAEELCTLPGIGQTRAESILAYRKENGAFSAIEDIMKVSGIKENSFRKIKDRITVK